MFSPVFFNLVSSALKPIVSPQYFSTVVSEFGVEVLFFQFLFKPLLSGLCLAFVLFVFLTLAIEGVLLHNLLLFQLGLVVHPPKFCNVFPELVGHLFKRIMSLLSDLLFQQCEFLFPHLLLLPSSL